MLKKISFLLFAALFSPNFLFAAEQVQQEDDFLTIKKENIQFSLSTEGAISPKSDYVVDSSTHFSPIETIFMGLEGRAFLGCNYKIATPLGDHWLLRDSKVNLNATLEVTPITVRPMFSVNFSPVPFLLFSTGASIGSGWSIDKWDGVANTKNSSR